MSSNGKKTTIWIFQATNLQNLLGKFLEMTKKEER